MTAGLATKPQETSGQNPAVEKGPKFPLHEFGYGAVALLLPDEEGFELFSNDLIQQSRFGITRLVALSISIHFLASSLGFFGSIVLA